MKSNRRIKTTQLETVDCKEVTLSNEFADYIADYNGDLVGITQDENIICYEMIDEKYVVVHMERLVENIEPEILEPPSLFGPYGTSSVDAAGILLLHTQPYLRLRGSGVLIGFLDSGIDYTHPAFVYEDNTTKILSIWDQTIQEGIPPINFIYGSEYTQFDINLALQSENPYDVVPSIDETGHGTFNAGVAAGRYVEAEGFVGAAPDAEIIMVKLKPAKEYLRNKYLLNTDAVAYQENDIMLGIKYLMQQASIYGMPLVICMTLGTNQGSHDGTSMLEEYLERVSRRMGYVVVIAAGNETDLGHHYLGMYPEGALFQDVEVNVSENERGFGIQVWAQRPDVYSVGILSPIGNVVPRIAPSVRLKEEFSFVLERTRIYIEYELIEDKSGDQSVIIRFQNPTPGIWTIRVYGDIVVTGEYNIWLDREGWILPGTRFLSPNISTTITVPSTANTPITVGAYNHLDNSIYIGSGRGPTRDERLKPEIVAPGVNVIGPLPDNRYGAMTGTSIAASHVAGASALILQGAIIEGVLRTMSTRTVKHMLSRGAIRRPPIIYPNYEWGFGELNLINSFEMLRGRLD
ncbi:subtilase family protein [Natranaerovirga hydrolytica]|uniref:Subtilase family protein n=1 Tax=Natranaerovirga hydrolytica TaxID=680378 RepID=A0A4R1MXY2_9FIRM|nr:S8 family peptidase [Natranaerovirga hydrolytica]TCK98066.1 subtilase family protein [Natranaerovirga hydrolytica]